LPNLEFLFCGRGTSRNAVILAQTLAQKSSLGEATLPNFASVVFAGFIEFKSRHRLTGGNLSDGSFFGKTQI